MTSDAGLLLLAEHATRSGDIARIAAALAPKLKAPASGVRKPRTPGHRTQDLLTQRVMQIIGGYPDGNDSNLLRHDPVLQMLVGKAAPGTADATLASQPTMSRLDNGFCLRQLVRAFDAMVDNFIASYAGKAPAGLVLVLVLVLVLDLVLDLDPTACIVYGQQELGMFSTHVGDTRLMPFHLYEGQSGHLIATALHPGKTPTAKAILGILRRVVKKLRQVWPRLPLVFRADGHHSKPEVLAWLEREGLRYVIGYAPNAVLKRQFAQCIQQAAKRGASSAGPSPGRTESMSGSSSPTSKTPEHRSSTKTFTAVADAPSSTSRTTSSA
ncbi:MAG: transposase [Prosthecobacter sp.]